MGYVSVLWWGAALRLGRGRRWSPYALSAAREVSQWRLAGTSWCKSSWPPGPSTDSVSRVRERFYWSGHHKDVIEWCKSCIVCVKKGKPQLRQRAPMKIYNVGAPLERIALDMLGPFPESKRGNKLVLCTGDYFTRWVTAEALPNQEAATIAQALTDHFLTVFGLPRIMHTDQGRWRDRWRKCLETNGIRHQNTLEWPKD